MKINREKDTVKETIFNLKSLMSWMILPDHSWRFSGSFSSVINLTLTKFAGDQTERISAFIPYCLNFWSILFQHGPCAWLTKSGISTSKCARIERKETYPYCFEWVTISPDPSPLCFVALMILPEWHSQHKEPMAEEWSFLFDVESGIN